MPGGPSRSPPPPYGGSKRSDGGPVPDSQGPFQTSSRFPQLLGPMIIPMQPLKQPGVRWKAIVALTRDVTLAVVMATAIHHLLRHPEPACARALKPWTMTMPGSLTDKTAARPRSPPRVSPYVVLCISTQFTSYHKNFRDQAVGPVTPRGPPRQDLSINCLRAPGTIGVDRNRRTMIGTSIHGINAAAFPRPSPGTSRSMPR